MDDKHCPKCGIRAGTAGSLSGHQDYLCGTFETSDRHFGRQVYQSRFCAQRVVSQKAKERLDAIRSRLGLTEADVDRMVREYKEAP